MTNIKHKNRLIPIEARLAVEQAKQYIVDEARGIQKGLLCRYPKLNRGVGKYFRFATIYNINGATGSGKSYLLSTLYSDFLDGQLNSQYKGKEIIIAHFGYEMEAKKELIRMIGTELNVSYSTLTTSEYNAKEQIYNPPSKELMTAALNKLDNLAGLPIYFYQVSGNLLEMENSIAAIRQRFPDKEIVIGLDHSLLVDKLDEANEIELLANIGKWAIKMKKGYGAMVIILGQLNGNIEKPERRDPRKPEMHYPIRTDIHGSQQIPHAADTVIILNRPDKLGIALYGLKKTKTEGIIHCIIVKNRDSVTGSVWFKDELAKGQIVETSPEHTALKKK